MSSVLLDTNILLRLVGRSAPEHPVVLAAIKKLSDRGTTFAIAPQVLVEFSVGTTRAPHGAQARRLQARP